MEFNACSFKSQTLSGLVICIDLTKNPFISLNSFGSLIRADAVFRSEPNNSLKVQFLTSLQCEVIN